MRVPVADVNKRSDEDIAEIVKTAADKYSKMGAVPILPLTESEFNRLSEIVDEGLDDG